MSDFRQFFYRGLTVLLPSVLTIWILFQAYRFVDQNIAQPINGICRVVVIRSMPLIYRDETKRPDWYNVNDEERLAERDRRRANKQPKLEDKDLDADIRKRALSAWWQLHWWLNLIGLGVAVILFYLAGRILGGFLGRKLTHRVERILSRLPIFKQVYPYVKQVVEFLLGEPKIELKRVGLVEYPRSGIWSLGFITGKPAQPWQDAAGQELLTLFIPSSPTPITGYTITVPRQDVVELDITPEEAFRFTVSGGVLTPGGIGEQYATLIETRTEDVPAADKQSSPDPADPGKKQKQKEKEP